MLIEISNKITIRYYDYKFESWLRKNYTFPNPEYITRVRLNKWLGGTPKTLTIYKQYNTDMCTLPYGCLYNLMYFVMSEYPPEMISVVWKTKPFEKVYWGDTEVFETREYQKEAIDVMCEKTCGILKAPCSSGKTVMGHMIAKRLGGKTLWLTHTKDLLNQSKAVGELLVGKENVGTITDGKARVGNTITYATVQTLAKLDMDMYKNVWDIVIVDECHRSSTKKASSQMSYVVNALNASRKYGLSATPETFDGYGKTILANLGNIEYVIEKDTLEECGNIMPVKIKTIRTGWRYPEESYQANGVVNFNLAVQMMCNDRERNELIVSLIDRPTIILSPKIEQLVCIMNCLSVEKQKRACLISTKHDESMVTAKEVLRSHTSKNREEYLRMLRDGELDIMFATYQLAKEGLNIPRLECVIMAFPAVDHNIITQSVGRVARAKEGKSEALCYDLVDEPKYFRMKYQDRKRLYKKNGNEVEE